MWNRVEISFQEKYVQERLKRENNPKEIEKLELTLAAYYNILYGTNKIKFDRIYKKLISIEMDIQLEKQRKEISNVISYNRILKNCNYLDDDYLKFLIEITTNLIDEEVEPNVNIYIDEEISEEKILENTQNFFKYLGDPELKKMSTEIIKKKNSIHFCDFFYKSYLGDAQGITFNDYVFNKSYLAVSKTNTVFDYQILTHEITHAIDNKMCQKLPSENYYGFHEICTYTMDYLFLDYLQQIGYDQNNIEILRKIKESYPKQLANKTIRLLNKYKVKKAEDLKKEHNFEILKNLLELESIVIAYALYNQIQDNKQQGLENLKKVMKTIIPKTEMPDFSFIGINNELILQSSREMEHSSKEEKNRQNK